MNEASRAKARRPATSEQSDLLHSQLSIKMYRVFEERLLLFSESPQMSEHIHCFMKNLEIKPQAPTIRALLLQAGSADAKRIQLSFPELGIQKNEPLGTESWIAFRRVFMMLAINPDRPNYILHASAVANKQGKAALVIGVSDAGKTTTLTGLLREGFSLVCDDYSPVTFDTGELIALPVGVTVTDGTVEMFPELRALRQPSCRFLYEKQVQWTVNLSDLYPAQPAFSKLEPTHVYFLFPDFGNASSIKSCDREWAQWWLQTGRLNSRNLTPAFVTSALDYHNKSFALTRTLLDRCHFFKVLNGNVHETVKLIAQSFGAS